MGGIPHIESSASRGPSDLIPRMYLELSHVSPLKATFVDGGRDTFGTDKRCMVVHPKTAGCEWSEVAGNNEHNNNKERNGGG